MEFSNQEQRDRHVNIRRTWVEYDDKGNLAYLMYEMEGYVNGQWIPFYKAIKMYRVLRVPKSAKKLTSLMEIQGDVISGMYQAKVNFVQIMANIIKPKPIGLLYMYGVQAASYVSAEDAKRDADNQFAALGRTISGAFRTLEMRRPSYEEMEWLRHKMQNMRHLSVVRGLPAPRHAAGDSNESNAMGGAGRSGSEETSEEFISGMSDYEYVAVLMASPIEQDVLMRWLSISSKDQTRWQSLMSGSKGVNFGLSLPMMFAANLGSSEGFSSGTSDTTSDSTGLSNTVSDGLTHGISDTQGHSTGISNSQGISDGVSNTHGTTLGTSEGLSSSHGTSASSSTSTSNSESDGTSNTASDGTSQTEGTSKGVATSHTDSKGTSASTSTGKTTSDSTTHSAGTSDSTSSGTSKSISDGNSHSQSTAKGISTGTAYSNSSSLSTSQGVSFSQGASAGIPGVANVSGGTSESLGMSEGRNWGKTDSAGSSSTNSIGDGTSHSNSIGTTDGTSHGKSLSDGVSHGAGTSSGKSTGTSNSTSDGRTVSNGTSESIGSTHSTSTGTTKSTSIGTGASTGTGTSDSIGTTKTSSIGSSDATGTTRGTSSSKGTTDSDTTGRSITESTSHALSKGSTTSHGISKGASQGLNSGFSAGTSGSMGLGASLGFSKSYQWKDIEIENIVMLLEFQRSRLMQATNGKGAFFVDFMIATENEQAKTSAKALASSAWVNERAMVNPLDVMDLNMQEEADLMYHMNAFSPCQTKEGIPGQLESYKYSTFLLSDELASYSHPPRVSEGGLFAEVDDLPVLSVPSNRQDGEIYVGQVLSGERFSLDTGYVTPFQFRIRQDELMHAFFAGGSRSGKTVCATRVVAELANNVRRGPLQKRLRIIALDPKQDWRVLARFVEPERFRFYSLADPRFLPVKLNLLKIPKNVWPERYMNSVVEIFCRSYGLGERGKQILTRAVFEEYTKAGCFRDDWEKHASERSQHVTMERIYQNLQSKKDEMDNPQAKAKFGNDARDAFTRVMDRMEAWGRVGSIVHTIFCDKNGISIDELLGADDVIVLESYGLESTTRSFIFGLVTSAIYQFCVHNGGFVKPKDQYETVLVIEEANEVLLGQDSGSGGSSGGGLSGPSEFERILDQSAGNGLFIWCITQKIADMPTSVVANCGIAFIGRQKREDDITISVRQIGRDPKFDDRPLVKYMPLAPTGWFIISTSRSFDLKDAQPCMVKVEPLSVEPPSNEELEHRMKMRQILKNKENQE